MSVYILGINSVYHESSACLLQDGKLIAVVEEERFNRIKHGKEARVDTPHELPIHSIRHCLDRAGISIKDVHYVGYSTNPKYIESRVASLRQNGIMSHWTSWADQETMLHTLALVPDQVRKLGFEGEFRWVGHHLSHAASAFYASPFEDAAVLVIDGIGDDTDTAACFHGVNNKLHSLYTVSYPHSVGFLWELLSLFLGFSLYDAAKIMGLASYGRPERYSGVLDQLIRLTDEGQFELDNDLLCFEKIVYYPPSADFTNLERLFGIKARQPSAPLTQQHQDIAAALQEKTNRLVLHILNYLHKRTGSKNVCLAGGVALNCVTNRYAFENSPFLNLYVQAGANDAGTAVGAAAYVWHGIMGQKERVPMYSPYTGPAFSNEDIEAALKAQGLCYERSENIEQRVAQLIAQRAVVGYFQGRMEFGPRALGSRSILADPRCADMREILNHKVKHREYFRPFAPSVLHEEVHNWFEIAKETTATDFMLMAYPAKADGKDKIPAVLHVDGTGRIQTVKKELSPRYHEVIRSFFELTGIPLVLNTSFNDQEPIICTPADAIHTFLKTNIDYLAIGDFLVSKGSSC